ISHAACRKLDAAPLLDSSHLLFSAIRGKRLGVSFRRQQVIESHIVDFLARQVSLVIEIDGDAYHRKRRATDARRDVKLRRAGYRVLRISASLVESDLPAAVALVREAINQC